jgi:hypothetical protein
LTAELYETKEIHHRGHREKSSDFLKALRTKCRKAKVPNKKTNTMRAQRGREKKISRNLLYLNLSQCSCLEAPTFGCG